MTTVHNLSEHILQIVVGNHLELLEIVGQDVGALIQITLVELISDRETLGTELSSTENQGMVEAQGEQKGFELIWFRAGIDSFLTKVGESSVQVILQGGWGFVSNLNGVLEDGLWDNITLRLAQRPIRTIDASSVLSPQDHLRVILSHRPSSRTPLRLLTKLPRT
jgi:hypothetical protein